MHEIFTNIIPANFHVKEISKDDVRKEVCSLNIKKLLTHGSIRASILKQCVDAYLPYLTDSFNFSLGKSNFPDELKHSEEILVYKKLDPLKKEDYGSVSLLHHVSKIFERIIYQQINTYMKKINHQNVWQVSEDFLVTMIEKWKKAVEKEEYVSALWIF